MGKNKESKGNLHLFEMDKQPPFFFYQHWREHEQINEHKQLPRTSQTQLTRLWFSELAPGLIDHQGRQWINADVFLSVWTNDSLTGWKLILPSVLCSFLFLSFG